jgi:hypothetical protein
LDLRPSFISDGELAARPDFLKQRQNSPFESRQRVLTEFRNPSQLISMHFPCSQWENKNSVRHTRRRPTLRHGSPLPAGGMPSIIGTCWRRRTTSTARAAGRWCRALPCSTASDATSRSARRARSFRGRGAEVTWSGPGTSARTMKCRTGCSLTARKSERSTGRGLTSPMDRIGLRSCIGGRSSRNKKAAGRPRRPRRGSMEHVQEAGVSDEM